MKQSVNIQSHYFHTEHNVHINNYQLLKSYNMGVCELENLKAHINTAYKRKAQKVHSVNASALDGSYSGGNKD